MSRYIDADKLMIVLNDWWYSQTKIESQNIPYDDYISVTIRSAMEAVKEQPTADVRENVKGMWVEVVDRTEMYDKEGVKTWGMLFQCNQCGFVLNAIEGHTGQYNFCPNCGAQMER